MGKRKKWIIGIISLATALVVICAVSLMITGQLKKRNEEAKLRREVEEIAGLDRDRNYDEWPLRCKGEYQEVEKAIRKYDELFYAKLIELQEVDGGEGLGTFISMENLGNDGPEFTESFRRLSEWEERWKKYNQEFSRLCSKEGIMEFLAPDVDEYYKTLYYKLVTEEDGLDVLSMKEMLDEGYQHQKEQFEWIGDFLDFLKRNRGKWEVKDEEMQADDKAFWEEYDEYANRLYRLRE